MLELVELGVVTLDIEKLLPGIHQSPESGGLTSITT